MTNANERHLWERSLREEIYDINAECRRLKGTPEERELKYALLQEEAEYLGIDPSRAVRIAQAAQVDFDWDEASWSMVKEEIPRGTAEEIAHNITCQISMTRSLRDNDLRRYWDRIELRLLCVGMVALAAAIGAAVVYRSEIFELIGHMASCVAGS